MSYEYFSEKLEYKNGYLQLYKFGAGKIPVLLFPSFPQSGLSWLLLQEKSKHSENFTFYTFDIPAWAGYSDTSIINLNEPIIQQYNEIANIISKHFKLENDINILGYSFGSRLALDYFLENSKSINKIVFISPLLEKTNIKNLSEYKRLIFFTEGRASFLLPIFKFLSRFYVRHFVKNSWIPKNFLNQYLEGYNNIDMQLNKKALVELLESEIELERLDFSNHPVMVVTSKKESKVFRKTGEVLRKILKNEKSLSIEGGHDSFVMSGNVKPIEKVLEFLS